jgi:transcriptional regulator with XRE-family HTH domain
MADASANERNSIFAEEAFVVEVQSLLHEIMEEKGISRADLARAMNVSRARITQLFSDECTNFTVRLLARAMYALEEIPTLGCISDSAEQLTDLEQSSVNSVAKVEHVLPLWAETELIDMTDPSCPANDNIFAGLAHIRQPRASFRIAA